MSEPIDQLIKAIRDEGPHPDVHQKRMKDHRREWPTLWRAIDALLMQGPCTKFHVTDVRSVEVDDDE